jgi:hypothetical protein
MKKRTWETLARTAIASAAAFGTFCALALPACAHATVLPLQGAVITGSYNGSGAAMLGLDDLFNGSPSGNKTALDPLDTTVEFLTGDLAFGFDFAPDGTLSIYNNTGAALGPGDYRFSFDFGSSLAAPIALFSVLDASMVSGMPQFAILNGGTTLSLDLSSLVWSGDFTPVKMSIAAAREATVPEPGSMSILLLGAGAIALARRRKAPRA